MRHLLAIAVAAGLALPAPVSVGRPRDPFPIRMDGRTVEAPPAEKALDAAPRKDATRASGTRRTAPGHPSPEPPPPPDCPTLAGKARESLDQGQAAEVPDLLRPCLDMHPVDPEVRKIVAEALLALDRPEEAADQWGEVLKAAPLDDDTRLRLADLWLSLDHPDSALELYQEVRSRRGEDPTLMRRVGLLLVDQDRQAEAIDLLARYLQIVPGDDEVARTLMQLYRWQDRPEDARRLLEARVRQRPDDLEALRQLAAMHLDDGREREAIEAYERLLAALPDDPLVIRTLGLLYEWNGRPRDALHLYDRLLEQQPFDGEIRARALSLSSDLGLGARARRYATLLRTSDPRFRDLARQSVLADTGLASHLSLEYTLFHEKDRLWFHGVGPRGAWQFRPEASVGAFYQFRFLRGPSSEPDRGRRTVLGHAVGAFAEADLTAVQLSLGASWQHYDTGFDSGNGYLVVSRDFDRVSLAAEVRRADVMTAIGDIETRIVANSLSLGLDSEPVDRMILHLGGSYGVWSDWNQRWSASAALGVRVMNSPRLELRYDYEGEGFRYPGRRYGRITYFAPEHYHLHGPVVHWTHAVRPWFAYSLSLHLWHAWGEGDNALLLQVAPQVTFRPGGRQLLQASYQRTDGIWGHVGARYQDDLLTVTWGYEF